MHMTRDTVHNQRTTTHIPDDAPTYACNSLRSSSGMLGIRSLVVKIMCVNKSVSVCATSHELNSRHRSMRARTFFRYTRLYRPFRAEPVVCHRSQGLSPGLHYFAALRLFRKQRAGFE